MHTVLINATFTTLYKKFKSSNAKIIKKIKIATQFLLPRYLLSFVCQKCNSVKQAHQTF